MIFLYFQPVYMASNCDSMEPMGVCQRYSAKDRCYMPYPQPFMNAQYNKFMGGVDLVDNSEKNYAITTRVKKWYWCLYTWFLNICMVQAWRLYRYVKIKKCLYFYSIQHFSNTIILMFSFVSLHLCTGPT